MSRLRLRLAGTLGRSVSTIEARFWLHQEGLRYYGAGWWCHHSTLSVLEPDEIVEKRSRQSADGKLFFLDNDRGEDEGAGALGDVGVERVDVHGAEEGEAAEGFADAVGKGDAVLRGGGRCVVEGN